MLEYFVNVFLFVSAAILFAFMIEVALRAIWGKEDGK